MITQKQEEFKLGILLAFPIAFILFIQGELNLQTRKTSTSGSAIAKCILIFIFNLQCKIRVNKIKIEVKLANWENSQNKEGCSGC